MIGTRLGPYLIADRLGSGGMGTVYLATRGGDRVAIKVFHPHLLEQPGFFERFRREAEVGQRVRHPNVVRTLDCAHEMVAGQSYHYLVMEYVEGATLRQTLDEIGNLPEALLREIARQVVAGLRAIHQLGIIHRDLKPENVLITRDDEVKIMDLGVALLKDETLRLSSSGQFVGSVLYAAPEQFRRHTHDLDARADLYSLGLVLYELAAGDLPFYDGEVVRIIEMKTDGAPRRLGEVRAHISPFFEEVVHTLLARDREKRFASAADLLDVLDRGEGSRWWREPCRERAVAPRRLGRIRVARETALHGRRAELGILRGRFEEAAAGQGRVILLEGEAGVGKTRLVDELLAELEQTGAELNLLYGGYPPGGAATATGALCSAFREHFGAEQLEAALGDHLHTASGLVDPFAALLRGEPAPRGMAPLDVDAIKTAFVRVVRSLAAERATVLILDDIHLAPEEGRAMFAALAWAASTERFLLVGTMRPTLPERWVADLTRLDHVTGIRLQRLHGDVVRRLLEDLLGSTSVARDLAPRVSQWSDGNPFFVLEILRGLQEGGWLDRGRDGAWRLRETTDRFPIPASVQDLIQARIGGLDEDERALLDAAACAGFEFDPALAGEAVGLGAIAVLRRLGHLERSHRLVRASGVRFVFDHHVVREVLYERLPQPLREGYHAALADALERRIGAARKEPSELESDAPVTLCEHFLKGARGPRALRYLDAALDHLEQSGLNVAALVLAQTALAAPRLLEPGRRASLLLRAAQLFDVVGRPEEGRSAVEEAVGLGEQANDLLLRVRAWRMRGAYALASGKPEEARSHLERAGELARQIEAPEEKAAIEVLQGHLLADAGCCAEAWQRYERALGLASNGGHRREVARAVGSLGLLCYEAGRYEEAVAHAERCIPVFREAGDPLGESKARALLAVALMDLGRRDEAKDELERQLELARRCGYRRGEMRAVGNLGLIEFKRGRLAAARARYEEAWEIAREIGDRAGEALEECRLGIVLKVLGRTSEAKARWERSMELCREAGDRRTEAFVRHDLGEAAEMEGRLKEAERWLRATIELRQDAGQQSNRAMTLVVLGRVLLAAGRREEALEAFREARALARRVDSPRTDLLAAAHLARLGEVDVAEALASAEAGAHLLTAFERLELEFLLWQAGAGEERLARAREILLEVKSHLPGDEARGFMEDVPLHRAIVAGESPGGPGPPRP